jgi:hypothetical protein
MTREPAPYAYVPKPRSTTWINAIGVLLRDGWGVEDIAIKLDCQPDQIRKQVALFRDAGLLQKWWPNEPTA